MADLSQLFSARKKKDDNPNNEELLNAFLNVALTYALKHPDHLFCKNPTWVNELFMLWSIRECKFIKKFKSNCDESFSKCRDCIDTFYKAKTEFFNRIENDYENSTILAFKQLVMDWILVRLLRILSNNSSDSEINLALYETLKLNSEIDSNLMNAFCKAFERNPSNAPSVNGITPLAISLLFNNKEILRDWSRNNLFQMVHEKGITISELEFAQLREKIHDIFRVCNDVSLLPGYPMFSSQEAHLLEGLASLLDTLTRHQIESLMLDISGFPFKLISDIPRSEDSIFVRLKILTILFVKFGVDLWKIIQGNKYSQNSSVLITNVLAIPKVRRTIEIVETSSPAIKMEPLENIASLLSNINPFCIIYHFINTVITHPDANNQICCVAVINQFASMLQTEKSYQHKYFLRELFYKAVVFLLPTLDRTTLSLNLVNTLKKIKFYDNIVANLTPVSSELMFDSVASRNYTASSKPNVYLSADIQTRLSILALDIFYLMYDLDTKLTIDYLLDAFDSRKTEPLLLSGSPLYSLLKGNSFSFMNEKMYLRLLRSYSNLILIDTKYVNDFIKSKVVQGSLSKVKACSLELSQLVSDIHVHYPVNVPEIASEMRKLKEWNMDKDLYKCLCLLLCDDSEMKTTLGNIVIWTHEQTNFDAFFKSVYKNTPDVILEAVINIVKTCSDLMEKVIKSA
jgi:hypothetical protein